MKKLILITLGALALSACTALGLASTAISAGATAADVAGVPPPATYCDKTKLDERVGISVELAYQAFRTAVELGVDAHIVKGALAVKLAALDNTAFAATVATQNAYKTCNAASYRAAADNATAAIKQALALLKGTTP